MRTPFPGMDPYLEHPALWPDVHNSLIAAIRLALAPRVAPRYYIGLERRAYLLTPDDVVFVGRPDIAFYPGPSSPELGRPSTATSTTVLDVEVPMGDEFGEYYLEIRGAGGGPLVTVLELLSPANKLHAEGRKQYLQKRNQVLGSATNLVEVDLLRAGEPMTVIGPPQQADYRLLVSRGHQRPRARLHGFAVRSAIPVVDIPLLPGEDEPSMDLGRILHDLYDQARFDLQIDYSQPPVPDLAGPDAAWSRALIEAAAHRADS